MKSVKVPALELFLHEMIPLAKAMGVGVQVSDARALVLTAPKEQNKNSLNTAFGGSLVALATLAGYGVVWELMREGNEADKPVWHIVVKESRAAYRRPVLGDEPRGVSATGARRPARHLRAPRTGGDSGVQGRAGP